MDPHAADINERVLAVRDGMLDAFLNGRGTRNQKVRRLATAMGLRRANGEKGQPRFEGPEVKGLQDAISGLANQLPNDLVHLDRLAKDSSSFSEELTTLLHNYGDKIWGNNITRTHLLNANADEEPLYPRDLYYPEHQELLKDYLRCWVIFKAQKRIINRRQTSGPASEDTFEPEESADEESVISEGTAKHDRMTRLLETPIKPATPPEKPRARSSIDALPTRHSDRTPKPTVKAMGSQQLAPIAHMVRGDHGIATPQQDAHSESDDIPHDMAPGGSYPKKRPHTGSPAGNGGIGRKQPKNTPASTPSGPRRGPTQPQNPTNGGRNTTTPPGLPETDPDDSSILGQRQNQAFTGSASRRGASNTNAGQGGQGQNGGRSSLMVRLHIPGHKLTEATPSEVTQSSEEHGGRRDRPSLTTIVAHFQRAAEGRRRRPVQFDTLNESELNYMKVELRLSLYKALGGGSLDNRPNNLGEIWEAEEALDLKLEEVWRAQQSIHGTDSIAGFEQKEITLFGWLLWREKVRKLEKKVGVHVLQRPPSVVVMARRLEDMGDERKKIDQLISPMRLGWDDTRDLLLSGILDDLTGVNGWFKGQLIDYNKALRKWTVV